MGVALSHPKKIDHLSIEINGDLAIPHFEKPEFRGWQHENRATFWNKKLEHGTNMERFERLAKLKISWYVVDSLGFS